MYGDFLRTLRRSRAMSQAELAEIVGISQPNLSAYERERRTPGIDIVNRWLAACGYQLAADGGDTTLHCPLPRTDWFPGDDLPPGDPDDPSGGGAVVPRQASPSERADALLAALELAEASR